MNIYLKENGSWKYFENLTVESQELKYRNIIINNSAKIGDFAKIGSTAKIGCNAVIGDNAKIGCAVIGNNAVIGDYTEIGNFAIIGNFAVIGNNAVISDFAKIGNSAIIGNNVKIGYNAKIGDYTKIYDGTEIGKYAKICDKINLQNSIYIKFNRDPITYTGNRTISIGCENFTIEEWLKSGEKIAKLEQYTDKEIAEYRTAIEKIDKLTKGDIK